MEKGKLTEVTTEKIVLISVQKDGETEQQVTEYLDELEFLAHTAGAFTQERFIQKLPQPHTKTYLGPGKLQEVKSYMEEHEIGCVIFDDELSASQIRNIEQILQVKVLDRTNLILDIFAKRATTAYAKTQVELAQYQYLLPRLTGMWTHLERQRGGIGMRGPGEREIETDRRIIRDKIQDLKVQLKKIDRQMITQRANRGQLVRVALVGYTNAGKSTLMNLLSKSDVYAKNELFATIDTTVRKVVLENIPFLLSDTVGFIRKLPHQLVESFKSTLDEVRESDLLLHVVDISHPNFEEQIKVVDTTLKEIGAADKPILLLFNKIDAYTFVEKAADDLTPSTDANRTLEDLMNTWMARMNGEAIFISAREKQNIPLFKKRLYTAVREIHKKRYPYNDFLY